MLRELASIPTTRHAPRTTASSMSLALTSRPEFDTDDAAVENILTQQNLTLATLEGCVAEGLTRQHYTTGCHLADPVSRNEQLPPPDAPDQPRDRRVAPVGKANDDVVDLAQVTRRADEGAADDLREPEARCGRSHRARF